MSQSANSRLRGAVLVIGTLELAAVLLFVVLMLQPADPLGKSIGVGMARLALVPLAVLVVPALVMGIIGRWLPAALAMLLMALPVAFALWWLA